MKCKMSAKFSAACSKIYNVLVPTQLVPSLVLPRGAQVCARYVVQGVRGGQRHLVLFQPLRLHLRAAAALMHAGSLQERTVRRMDGMLAHPLHQNRPHVGALHKPQLKQLAAGSSAAAAAYFFRLHWFER